MSVITPVHRRITEAEAAVIERTIHVAALDGAKDVTPGEIQELLVARACDCGCASIDFVCAPSDELPYKIADGTGLTASGENVNVLIWARSGQIYALEVCGFSSDPASLPVIESIKSWAESG